MTMEMDTELRVTVDIRPGPVSPAQGQAWKRFWQKMIAETKSEVEAGCSVPLDIKWGQEDTE